MTSSITWVQEKRGIIISRDGRFKITARQGRHYLRDLSTNRVYSLPTAAKAKAAAQKLEDPS